MPSSHLKNQIIKYTIVALVGVILGAYIHLVTTLMDNPPAKRLEKAQVFEAVNVIENEMENSFPVVIDNQKFDLLEKIPAYYQPYISNLDIQKQSDVARLFANSPFENKSCPTSVNDFVFFPNQIVNRVIGLGNFVPGQLVNISPSIPSSFSDLCLDHLTALRLAEMIRVAKNDGVDLMVSSAYRSVTLQERFYKSWLENRNENKIETSDVALPTHSEHQLGTTVDLTSKEINNSPYDPKFATTNAYKWLTENANQFGFYESYPANNPNSDYQNEPWHWRYLGN